MGATLQARQTIEEMSAIVQTSSLRARFPEALHDHNAHTLKGTDLEYVHVSPEANTRYAEATGTDLFELANSHANQVAKETGGDFRIPMATYLAHSAGSKADADLMDSMRLRPDALDYSEALAAHIGSPSPGLSQTAKRNGPYKAIGYLNDQEIDSYLASHLRNSGPKASEAPRFEQAHPAFSSALPKPQRLQNSGNTKRTPDGLSITSTTDGLDRR
jgi:hypothetical protein